MGILSQIFGGGLSGVGDLVKSVVGTFKLDPTVKAQIEAQIEEHQFELAKLDAQMEQNAQDVAGQNIRSETGSSDKYTSRARPTFLYIMEGILVMNYVVFPLAGKAALAFPSPLFWLFGSCMLGYTGARTWEKIYGAQNALGGDEK